MLTRQQKEEQVEVLRGKLAKASSLVALDYRGMTVSEANTLRQKLRAAGGNNIEYRVAKNTLLKIAARGTSLEPISKHLEGPTALAFVNGDVFYLTRPAVSALRVSFGLNKPDELLEGVERLCSLVKDLQIRRPRSLVLS